MKWPFRVEGTWIIDGLPRPVDLSRVVSLLADRIEGEGSETIDTAPRSLRFGGRRVPDVPLRGINRAMAMPQGPVQAFSLGRIILRVLEPVDTPGSAAHGARTGTRIAVDYRLRVHSAHAIVPSVLFVTCAAGSVTESNRPRTGTGVAVWLFFMMLMLALAAGVTWLNVAHSRAALRRFVEDAVREAAARPATATAAARDEPRTRARH